MAFADIDNWCGKTNKSTIDEQIKRITKDCELVINENYELSNKINDLNSTINKLTNELQKLKTQFDEHIKPGHQYCVHAYEG